MARLDLQHRLISVLAQVGNSSAGQVLPAKKIVTAMPIRHIESHLMAPYNSLDGLLKSLPLRSDGWDVAFEAIAVELDEELLQPLSQR